MTQTIALLGNPNTGKTSLFNQLTGSYEYVGNWSGVTVEKKVGRLRSGNGEIVDLPGVYSLHPLSRDEAVVTRFLLTEPFSQILNIVDASQLRRNLQLSVQLLELGKPLVIALNMTDVAKSRGIVVDERKLSEALGVPVTEVIARNGKGCDRLGSFLEARRLEDKPTFMLDYGPVVEDAIGRFCEYYNRMMDDKPDLPARWLAIQYLEGNKEIHEHMNRAELSGRLLELLRDTERKLAIASAPDQRQRHSGAGGMLHRHIHRVRQRFIDTVVNEVSRHSFTGGTTVTERFDSVVTNKYLGIPVFFGFMYLMFMLTFDWLGLPLSDALDAFFTGPLTEGTSYALNAAGVSPFIEALILNGIIAGVGGVLVFVPQIFILFLFISILEDSGYMARVAMVMDRLMDAVGLNGKAFIPMIIGFGCNVPGVMAARTIEQPKERLLTLLLTPLMSCSARLPVYALFAGAFFANNQAAVVFSLYLLGIVIALLLAKIFSQTVLKSESSFFLIELPPYRVPHWGTLWRSTWDKGKGFIRKAGTFIFAGSVMIWLFSYAGPGGLDVEMEGSFLAIIGGVFAPLFEPLGFGTWQAGAALLTGFLAKEVVVSTMNIIYYAPNDAALQGIMAREFTPLSAYSFMAFVLLYVPCLATTAMILKETASRKWTAFAVGYALAIAYAVSLVIYQGGKMFGLS